MEKGIKYIIDNADAIWESVAKTKSTRGTLLHSTKLPKWKWLVAIYQVANIKNISVRELAGTISVNRNTAWKLLQKIRYSIPQEDIKLIGETIIDETYIGGWKNKHLSYKWDYMRRKGFVGQHQKRYTKTQILRASSDYKQHILGMIDEEGKTKLLHLPNPITKECVKLVLSRESITTLICDESKLYEDIGIPVSTNNHSKHQWLTSSGKSSNAIENRFSWLKNKLRYNTHTSEKYLQLYLNQFAFQFNTSSLSKEERFITLLRCVCTKKVRDKDLFNIDYKQNYPISRREIKREELKIIQQQLGELGTVLY